MSRLEAFDKALLAIAPEWQRQGVAELRTQARLRHPMTPREATLGWSNEHSVARALVAAACDAAREAGCRWVAFHAPPRFRHWPLLRAMGFAEREGRRYMFVDIPSVTGTGDLDHWQLVPGDADAD